MKSNFFTSAPAPKSSFFEPVSPPKKPSMEKEIAPDTAPAGVAPFAALFAILPKSLQGLIKFGAAMLQKLLDFVGAVIEQSLQDAAKANRPEGTMHAAREAYSSHASFDHLRRLEKLEEEMAQRRGGLRNKTFHKTAEQRLQRLERKLKLRKK